MGLSEEFRDALRSAMSVFADATGTLRNGPETGSVVRTSSTELADEVTDDEPAEAARFMACANDFPTLEVGDAVSFCGELRVVTSLSTDPVGATFKIGLSHPFARVNAAFVGYREDRRAVVSCDALAISNGPASTAAEAWTVAVRAADWQDETPPQVGDFVEFFRGVNVRLKVSVVRYNMGTFVLTCRTR